MLTTLHESAQHQTSFSGMLLENVQLSNSSSLALLFGRLLIAVLFLYVGLSELHRLLFQPFTPYLPGDGHDVVWPKAVELLLAVPFIIGVKTSDVARLLAGSLVLEALYAWSWWRIPGKWHAPAAGVLLLFPGTTSHASPLRLESRFGLWCPVV